MVGFSVKKVVVNEGGGVENQIKKILFGIPTVSFLEFRNLETRETPDVFLGVHMNEREDIKILKPHGLLYLA